MSLEAMSVDQATCRRTERRTFAASVAVHVLLLLILMRPGPGEPQTGGTLTEVSLLEPAAGLPRAAAPALPAAPAPVTQTGVLKVRKEEVRFKRAEQGDTKPDPQSDDVFEDRLNERLATLQRDASPSLAGLATVTPQIPKLASPTGLPGGTGTGGSAPISLNRSGPDGGGGSAPLELARGGRGGAGGGRDLALAQLPADKPAKRAASPPPKAIARQSLSGVSLAGPIADRPVLEAVRPDYPEWAKEEAVEGSVTLYFVVLPDGTVKPNVLVQKTAGFGDFDDNAVAALGAWRFAPLPAGRTGDQWGTITFHFRLSEAH